MPVLCSTLAAPTMPKLFFEEAQPKTANKHTLDSDGESMPVAFKYRVP